MENQKELSTETNESLVSQEYGSLVGRELDAAVAERVLGWTELSTKYGPLCGQHPESEDSLRKYGPTSVPSYSTDIAAAMEVLNKADGLWELSRYPYLDDDAEEDTPYTLLYSCRLRFGDHLGSAEGDTAPEAICRAALNAVKARE